MSQRSQRTQPFESETRLLAAMGSGGDIDGYSGCFADSVLRSRRCDGSQQGMDISAIAEGPDLALKALQSETRVY